MKIIPPIPPNKYFKKKESHNELKHNLLCDSFFLAFQQ